MASEQQTEIDYPGSDDRPFGEDDLHRNWMIRIIEALKFAFQNQRVYVSGDLLLYYEEGNPETFVVPDAFVVKDCNPGRRDNIRRAGTRLRTAEQRAALEKARADQAFAELDQERARADRECRARRAAEAELAILRAKLERLTKGGPAH